MSSSVKNNHHEDHEAKKELATDEHRLPQIKKNVFFRVFMPFMVKKIFAVFLPLRALRGLRGECLFGFDLTPSGASCPSW